MAKKNPDIYERQKRRFREAYNRAPLIRDRFPGLNSLVINMNFKNPDWGGDPSPREQTFNRDSKAFFNFECPHRECVSGGFDISGDVSRLVASGGNETSGTITCQGWQDKERIGKHRCSLEMNYKIIASYGNNA